ncbi:hypothetical protein ACIRD2_21465 [Streptomyces sp. NPDC093595]|uniref:hypothetical protein n=1 Tax=Streptomyces sp. NPDC093595 TaxID=3366045 RepID=UPI003828340C
MLLAGGRRRPGEVVVREGEGEAPLPAAGGHLVHPVAQAGLGDRPGPELRPVQHALDGAGAVAEADVAGLGVRGAQPAAHGEPSVRRGVGDADGEGSLLVGDPVDEGPHVPDAGFDGPLVQEQVPAALGQLHGAGQHGARPALAGRGERQPGLVRRAARAAAPSEDEDGRGGLVDRHVEGEAAGGVRDAVRTGRRAGRGGLGRGVGHADFPFRSTSAAL